MVMPFTSATASLMAAWQQNPIRSLLFIWFREKPHQALLMVSPYKTLNATTLIPMLFVGAALVFGTMLKQSSLIAYLLIIRLPLAQV
jgi:exo-beta-1,3-glucanase (GH17 family)